MHIISLLWNAVIQCHILISISGRKNSIWKCFCHGGMGIICFGRITNDTSCIWYSDIDLSSTSKWSMWSVFKHPFGSRNISRISLSFAAWLLIPNSSKICFRTITNSDNILSLKFRMPRVHNCKFYRESSIVGDVYSFWCDGRWRRRRKSWG